MQFPMCVLNTRTLEVEAEFHTYVRPVRHPRLTPFCTQLTGIEQARVDPAPTFPEVWARYQQWLAALGVSEQTAQAAVVTCGDWDLKTMLPAQLELSGLSRAPLIMRRWINVKKLFQLHYRTVHAGDMVGMLRHLHLPLEGRHHSGIDDARNITRVVKRMLTDKCVFQLTWRE
jgi:ERI1 exoribonuclease 3